MKVTHVLGLVAVGLFGISGTSQAQEIQFQGSTKGCLYASWESGCIPSASSSLLFLTFVNSTFDVTTADWNAGIGSAAGSPNVNNLGSFAVSGDPASYNGSHFLLDVVFSLPTITSTPSFFTAAVRGTVSATATGLVKILFDPGYQAFDFVTPTESGTFMLSVNNASLTPGASPVALTGDVEVTSLTATPEPATTALLATGLAGLVPVVRLRRRKKQNA